MKTGFYLIFLILITVTTVAQSLTDYVNPFIGTSNYGATNPGAVYPEGMVSVSPFNVYDGDNKMQKDKQWLSTPYVYENNFLTGFTHINLSGVGCPDLGSILLMPTAGELQVGARKYGSQYEGEVARAGYYSTHLTKYDVHAEMSATPRTGISRYTFPAGNSHILLNLGLGLTNETGAMVRIVSDREVEGFKMIGTFCYHPQAVRTVYFVAQFSKPADDAGVWKKMPKYQAEASWTSLNDKYKLYPDYRQAMAGDSIGVYFNYHTSEHESIEVKVGISYVSIENARQNLRQEQTDFDFDAVMNSARKAWEDKLSVVNVKGGSKDEKTIFYTALYHLLLHPNIFQDVNGEYIGMDNAIHKLEKENRFTVFSLWDTYRNVHPLMSLLFPQTETDIVNSMLSMYEEHGWLPKWELLSRETLVMEGDPSIPVIADTYLRGLRDFDVDKAYGAMIKSATSPGQENELRPDNDDYMKMGYVPLRSKYDNSVSHALEYYIADWNLAQLAKTLGKEDDYKLFLKRSMGYKNYYDPETGLLRPKLPNGQFLTPFDPEQGKNFEPTPGFHEGTSWTYSFYVPHDIPGLIKLMGGPGAFSRKLQQCFDRDLFDMANEPDITYPYLFDYVQGDEWRTQEKTLELIQKYFKNDPGGIPGNDDTGTMSSWLIFSMMGFYPHCPGDMTYALTTPIFDEVDIKLDNRYYPNTSLIIQKTKNGSGGPYIHRITLGDKQYHQYFVSQQELLKAGKIIFQTAEMH